MKARGRKRVKAVKHRTTQDSRIVHLNARLRHVKVTNCAYVLSWYIERGRSKT